MRLLPKDTEVGWTPYAWLVYLAFVPFGAFSGVRSRAGSVADLVGMALFLVLYFWGYWLNGRKLLWIVLAITLLGIGFAPFNAGVAVYFIYAASFLCNAGDSRFAFRLLLLLLAIIGLETWALHLGPQFWIPAGLFSLLVGSVNIHYKERRRATEKLLRAQDEIERMAKIAERERIARDLHDVLGHTLSVIVIKSELAARIAEKDPARAIREIQDVERISRDALAQVRSTVRGYQDRSLQAEIQQATTALESAGVKVSCDFPPAKLPSPQEGVLALALREGVTNVIRHAKAHSCNLRLQQANGACELEIKDDGCGQLAPEGVGLSGMRQRVEALGGSLRREISSGTRLVVSLPLATP
ncbi:MAG TPA: sensor histidine kinase [Candidatus Angelobacter sp.]|nr:sensor histidine kinase [Candidatus Angelobacter sp.]